jgi:Zn-dependent M28 family amino/carboxypeptidase
MKKLTFVLLILSNYSIYAQKIDRNTLLNDVQTLSSDSFEGRKTGSAGNFKAADYITNRFDKIGLKSYNENYKHPFIIRNRRNEQIKGINLIGYIKGKSEKVIIISAHYDHVGINNSEIFNGADDNASGVAAILASAKYFSENKPNNTLLFIAFDAEEIVCCRNF